MIYSQKSICRILCFFLIISICLPAYGELIIKISSVKNFLKKYDHSNRYESLFYKNAIDANGWQWFVDNFIIESNVIKVEIIQYMDNHSLLISSRKTRSEHYYDAIKKTFDRMAESNDSVCLFLPFNPNIQLHKFESDTVYRSNVLNDITREWFDDAISLAYQRWESYWVGNAFMSPSKCISYQSLSRYSLCSDDIRDEYFKECEKLGLTPVTRQNEKDLKNISNEELELYRKFVNKDIEKVLSQPFPIPNFSIDITYDVPVDEVGKQLYRTWIKPTIK